MSSNEATPKVATEPTKSPFQTRCCLRCGGERMEPGTLTERHSISFYPTNAKFWTFVPHIGVEAFMCLDCGHIELFGDVAKVEKVVAKNKPQ